jgi:hypothetical protein
MSIPTAFKILSLINSLHLIKDLQFYLKICSGTRKSRNSATLNFFYLLSCTDLSLWYLFILPLNGNSYPIKSLDSGDLINLDSNDLGSIATNSRLAIFIKDVYSLNS